MSFVHKKLRNRLSIEKVEKLIYIGTNNEVALNATPKHNYNNDDSDNEEYQVSFKQFCYDVMMAYSF
jgi:hypothetical protein